MSGEQRTHLATAVEQSHIGYETWVDRCFLPPSVRVRWSWRRSWGHGCRCCLRRLLKGVNWIFILLVMCRKATLDPGHLIRYFKSLFVSGFFSFQEGKTSTETHREEACDIINLFRVCTKFYGRENIHHRELTESYKNTSNENNWNRYRRSTCRGEGGGKKSQPEIKGNSRARKSFQKFFSPFDLRSASWKAKEVFRFINSILIIL